MAKPLQGRSALITGANQGLGRAIARAYVEAGASVFLCARDGALLDRARFEVAALASPGQLVLGRTADVSRPAQVEELAAAALEAFPQLQILVNNAGVYGPLGLIEGVDWNAWVQAIEINLLGSILMCRALLPHFKSQHYGKIVSVSAHQADRRAGVEPGLENVGVHNLASEIAKCRRQAVERCGDAAIRFAKRRHVIDELDVALATATHDYVAKSDLPQEHSRRKVAARALDFNSLAVEVEHSVYSAWSTESRT